MAGIWQAQYPDFKPIYAPVPAGPGGSISVVGGEDIVMTVELDSTRPRRRSSSASPRVRAVPAGDGQDRPDVGGQRVRRSAGRDCTATTRPFIEQLKTAKSRRPCRTSRKIDTMLRTT